MPLTQADLLRWEQEGDIDKFAQILKLLHEDQFVNIRVLSVQALSRLRNLDGLHLLIDAIVDDNKVVSDVAEDELIAWGNEDLESICKVVEDDNEPDRRRSLGLYILSKIQNERVIKTYFSLLKRGKWIDAIRRFVAETNNIEPFTSKLMDVDPAIRNSAILALGKVSKNTIVLDGLVNALGDEDVQVKSSAAYAIAYEISELRKNGNGVFNNEVYKKAVEPLMKNLGDDDFLVRANAVNALGQIQDQRAIDDLIPLIRDPFEKVRINTACALAMIPNKKAFKYLSSRYSSEPSVEVRKFIINAIDSSLHRDAFSFLIGIVENEKEPKLRKRAFDAICSRKTAKGFKVLSKILDEGTVEDINLVVNSLENYPDRRSLGQLLKLLEQDRDGINLSVLISAIVNLKNKKALEPLLRILGKKNNRQDSHKVLRAILEILNTESFDQYLANTKTPNDEDFLLGVQKYEDFLEAMEKT